MITRCRSDNPDTKSKYKDRGITVSKEWENFSNFRRDMLESYEEHVKKYGEGQTSLDRIDNNKGYCKENTRWATWSEQINNRRKRKDNTSGYTGVSLDKRTGKWRARIKIKGKERQIGVFGTPEEAFNARENFIKERETI